MGMRVVVNSRLLASAAALLGLCGSRAFAGGVAVEPVTGRSRPSPVAALTLPSLPVSALAAPGLDAGSLAPLADGDASPRRFSSPLAMPEGAAPEPSPEGSALPALAQSAIPAVEAAQLTMSLGQGAAFSFSAGAELTPMQREALLMGARE